MTGGRPVFVTGLHRSGTTLLADCLAGHPGVSGFAGTGAPQDEGQYLQTVLPTDEELGGPGRFALAPGAHLTEASPLATAAVAGTLWRQWGRFWRPAPVLLTKSPVDMVRMRLLQRLFSTASFVLITRHPVPVGVSTALWTPALRPIDLVGHWLHAHDLAAADAPHLARLAVVRYEDLVDRPAAVLARLARFLGLADDFRPAVDPAAGRRHAASWDAFRTALPGGRTGAELAERVARHGYRLDGPA